MCLTSQHRVLCNTRPVPFPVFASEHNYNTHAVTLLLSGFLFYPNIVSLGIINNKQNWKKKKKKRHRKAKPYLHWKWWIIESGRHTHRCRHRRAFMHTHLHAHMLYTHTHTHVNTGGKHSTGSPVPSRVWLPECEWKMLILQLWFLGVSLSWWLKKRGYGRLYAHVHTISSHCSKTYDCH